MTPALLAYILLALAALSFLWWIIAPQFRAFEAPKRNVRRVVADLKPDHQPRIWMTDGLGGIKPYVAPVPIRMEGGGATISEADRDLAIATAMATGRPVVMNARRGAVLFADDEVTEVRT